MTHSLARHRGLLLLALALVLLLFLTRETPLTLSLWHVAQALGRVVVSLNGVLTRTTT